MYNKFVVTITRLIPIFVELTKTFKKTLMMDHFLINKNNKFVVQWNLSIKTANLSPEYMSWS